MSQKILLPVVCACLSIACISVLRSVALNTFSVTDLIHSKYKICAISESRRILLRFFLVDPPVCLFVFPCAFLFICLERALARADCQHRNTGAVILIEQVKYRWICII